ncbi:Pentatricopeptide repeat-containing protein [Canna indica]|uniref:Pentatricopeptide repeat-containing protein n=1 Tax=Canna indica TaxID=4628 RepID=A0AAQ3KUL2_9LILI|nr:Pentatricopeptide repeat-containing protein [Canna indica]
MKVAIVSCISPPSLPAHVNRLSRSASLTIRTNLFLSSAAKSKPIDHVLRLFHLLPARDTVTWNTAISACLHRRRADVALRLFLDMLLSSSHEPDPITLSLVFRACSEEDDSRLLPQIHAYVLKLCEQLTSSELTVLNTCLLNLYRNFGQVELAHMMFDKIPNKDVVAFTSMLMTYMEDGRHAEALRIFQEMVESDPCMPNEHAYTCALRACASMSALFDGRQIHALVLKSNMVTDVFAGTSLVDLYAKCGEVELARKAFSQISEPSVVSWNALLTGKLDGEEGLQLFGRMRSSGVSPDHVTFANVLRACRDGVGIEEVRQLHGIARKMMEIELNRFVSSALFEAYLDHGCFTEAQKVFGEMAEKDDVSYNLAIQGYSRNGHALEAVDLFNECLKKGKELREVTISLIMKELGLGKQLHAAIIKFGCYGDCNCECLFKSLIRMYLDHHLLDDAISVAEQIPCQEFILWTSLISGLSRIGKGQIALKLYLRMLTEESVEPLNPYMFSALLSSCAQFAALEEGKQIHAQIIKLDSRVMCDSFVANSLLYMYAKCGFIEEAIRIFEDIPKRDLATWNAMISSLAQHGFAERAIEMFQELVDMKEVEPNDITYVAVLSACNHCGLLEKGYQYFRSIKEPTIDHYACLIDMFARAGRSKEAVDFVEGMPFEGNEHIWSSLLASSCAHGNIDLGEYTAKKLLQLNPTDSGIYIALSNLYALAGRWDDVEHVRKLMKSRADAKQPGLSWLRLNSQQFSFAADSRSVSI